MAQMLNAVAMVNATSVSNVDAVRRNTPNASKLKKPCQHTASQTSARRCWRTPHSTSRESATWSVMASTRSHKPSNGAQAESVRTASICWRTASASCGARIAELGKDSVAHEEQDQRAKDVQANKNNGFDATMPQSEHDAFMKRTHPLGKMTQEEPAPPLFEHPCRETQHHGVEEPNGS